MKTYQRIWRIEKAIFLFACEICTEQEKDLFMYSKDCDAFEFPYDNDHVIESFYQDSVHYPLFFTKNWMEYEIRSMYK